jgi:glycosyltransferase involved in cell wall biosynthesis/2-polyprenyl-3-methyl-5-hydroxy-6-metoxy-1,4-benzoquinol methylase
VPKVVITLPAYRAEATLAKTVADIPAGVADRLILVDDASPDNTAALARSMGIDVHVHPTNRGYGGNQKTCYTEALRAGADVVVLLHPDYQYDPKAVPLLIAPILGGDADMTFGSRFAGLGDPIGGGMPAYRYWGNRLTTILENLMLGARFTDMHSGMRAYTRACLLALPFLGYSDDFVFDSELLVDAVTTGQRVVEVPIPTRYTKESSSIAIWPSLRYIGGSLAYCARRTLERGRRGRRSPVTSARRRSPRRLGRGPLVERECALCGGHEHSLVFRATDPRPPTAEAFACTTDALGLHDDIVQCRRCGMVSSLVPVGTEDVARAYVDVVDERYLEEEGARRALFRWVAGRIGAYAVRGRRLLELGAGVGLFLDVARRLGWDVRGIEASKWAVEQGRARFDVPLRQGLIEDLDEPPGSADAVVMLDVLEHLADPLDALRRAREVVDEEGILALTTIDIDGPHARARGERWPWLIRSHLHCFSPATLAGMLERAGFRLVGWERVPRSFPLSYVARRGGRALGALGRAAGRLSRVADPPVPLGWLGDTVLAIARPGRPFPPAAPASSPRRSEAGR